MDKVKVLFLAAHPVSSSRQALEEELRLIDEKVRGAAYRDNLELISHWAVQLDDLPGLMYRHQPQVIHLSGRAFPEGRPVETGEPIACLGQDILDGLTRLLPVLTDDVRVLFLNACYREEQALEFVRTIPCAVGTSPVLRAEHAIAFAAGFYQALAYGRSVQESFDVGAWIVPTTGYPQGEPLVRIHARSGFDPDQLLLVAPPTSAEIAQNPAVSVNRVILVKELGGLTPGDLALLVSAIEGAETRVSRQGTVPEQVAELVRWAGSPTGPGLATIAEVYRELQSP